MTTPQTPRLACIGCTEGHTTIEAVLQCEAEDQARELAELERRMSAYEKAHDMRFLRRNATLKKGQRWP